MEKNVLKRDTVLWDEWSKNMGVIAFLGTLFLAFTLSLMNAMWSSVPEDDVLAKYRITITIIWIVLWVLCSEISFFFYTKNVWSLTFSETAAFKFKSYYAGIIYAFIGMLGVSVLSVIVASFDNIRDTIMAALPTILRRVGVVAAIVLVVYVSVKINQVVHKKMEGRWGRKK